ncbi:peptidoglycan bridge formation glycyltransferase FemA/FemB family protein [Candidatus Peregrinibacteria bacterium]|nr:MAG: peptidoglycan bridge formation glycyltransferase FemA/FemB family protein [Candidatus Peregrinibacteria bacterium]
MDLFTRWIAQRRRNLWQHPLWKAFQSALGYTTWNVESGSASALLIARPLGFGQRWIEVPRGPLFGSPDDLPALMQKIKKIGRDSGAVFIRFSCYDPAFFEVFPMLKPTPYDRHPQTSLVLDLTQEHEAILEQMKPKGRYNIRVAQRHGIEVAPSDNLEAFYTLLNQTGNRDGFGVHPMAYYEEMVDQLDGSLELMMAYYNDEPVAGGIFIFVDEWAIYYYGASDHAFRPYMAPYLLQWEAIKEGKRRGCRYYDFLGIAPTDDARHPWAGVTDFKKKFGGNVMEYPQARDLVLKPFWYSLYRLYKALKK